MLWQGSLEGISEDSKLIHSQPRKKNVVSLSRLDNLISQGQWVKHEKNLDLVVEKISPKTNVAPVSLVRSDVSEYGKQNCLYAS